MGLIGPEEAPPGAAVGRKGEKGRQTWLRPQEPWELGVLTGRRSGAEGSERKAPRSRPHKHTGEGSREQGTSRAAHPRTEAVRAAHGSPQTAKGRVRPAAGPGPHSCRAEPGELRGQQGIRPRESPWQLGDAGRRRWPWASQASRA